MNFSPQTKERLARQQDKYMNSLSGKKDRIFNCWSLIQTGGWTLDLLSELRTEVHRLAGSAGSYGLVRLGKAAQNLDRMLALESEMSSLSSSIAELVDKLFSAFDEVISNSVSASTQIH